MNGDFNVWTSTQGNFATRDGLAKLLGVSESKIEVNSVEMGGGFGAKIQPLAAAIPAIIASQLRRPVKYVLTRSDDLRSSVPSSQGYFEITLGTKRDGTLPGLVLRGAAYRA